MTTQRKITSRKIFTEEGKIIGERIKAARQLANISQSRLAGDIGITFQQVQKYESHANRVSADKLIQIARITKQPLTFFFAGLDIANDPSVEFPSAEAITLYRRFLRLDDITRRMVDVLLPPEPKNSGNITGPKKEENVNG